MDKTLSFVVPVYESPDMARKLAARIPVLRDVAGECGYRLIESVFVDDGSTLPLEKHENVTRLVTHPRNMGKGRSVRDGALASSGDWVLMSDVDESVPLEEFRAMAKAAEGNVWMVCASRRGRPGVPLKRKILSGLFSVLLRLFGIRGVKDTQCGFKLFRMDRMRAIFEEQTVDRFAFDVELIERVRAAGGEIAEVAVKWQGNKRSTLKIFRDAPKMLLDIARLKFSGILSRRG